MKKIRTLVIGVMLGGGLGATLGSEVVSVSSLGLGWSAIEIGLLIGTVIGFCSAILASIISTNNESRRLMN